MIKRSLVLSAAFSLIPLCALAEEPMPAGGEAVEAAKSFIVAIMTLESGKGLAGKPISADEARGLHAEAVSLLHKRDFAGGEKAYEKLLAADPFDRLALYNIACLYSLWGKPEKALDFLERSVRAGYRDFNHMAGDSDLDPLRGLDAYKAIESLREGAITASSIHEALAVARASDALAVVLAGETALSPDLSVIGSIGPGFVFCIADSRPAVPVPAAIDGTAIALCPEGRVLGVARVSNDPEAAARAIASLGASRPLPPAQQAVIPMAAREYVAGKHFNGADPADPAIDAAVEILRMPHAMLQEICAERWEARQIRTFAPDKAFFLLHVPGKASRVILFRGGTCRKDQEIPPERIAVLRRLYDPALISAPQSPLLDDAAKAAAGADPARSLSRAMASVAGATAYPLDEETLGRAAKNFAKSAGSGLELALALDALALTEYGPECLWAALWLISRMDAMLFARMERDASVPDLSAVNARSFFENVYYAVKARNVFPWGRDVGNKDFLQHVLSPRGTNEPLQRWRRLYFEALEPAMRGFTSADRGRASELATACCYDFFQYEGATTWEDFGMLTALAVHEGRCEDCSNVQNSMIRAAGLPACQAFTPHWAHGDGNHAWTVVPLLDGAASADGRGAAKVYVKTWDRLEDVTAKNTPVVDVAVESKTESAKAELRVWNHDDWRVIARSSVAGGKAAFADVGRSKEFVFLVRIEGERDRLVRVTKKGLVFELGNGPLPTEGAFDFEPEKSGPLGEFAPGAAYTVFVHESGGFVKIESRRLSTGAVGFSAHEGRLYRITGPGVKPRPFTLIPDAQSGECEIIHH